MNLKLTPTEKLALVKALKLHYLQDAEKLSKEGGFERKKMTLKDLIIGVESMPTGKMQ